MDQFQEIKPALERDEALAEANRCLMCYDAPCTRACPTHIDVPGFIKKIATENLRGSARTILESNILGASCARVCPTEVLCEGACVLNDVHKKPIKIGQLQRHATDWLMARGGQSGIAKLFSPPALTGSEAKVAIIGGGPSGLACAAELRRLGYAPVVFDSAEKPGGLNTYGVAEYKMRPAFALQEVAWVAELGVEIKSGVTVGKDVTVAELDRDYAAVFIGVGLGKIGQLGIPGEDLPGVVDALDFIADLKVHRERAKVGKRVVVIGGGNTAIDAVTQAAALGAEKVHMVYRRGRADMPAYHHEQELAVKWGCRFVMEAQPVRVEGSGKVEKLVLVRMRPTPSSGKGRAAMLEPIPGSEFEIACDMILKASGQQAHALLASLPNVKLEKGRPVVDRATGQTSNPRWFAGGDCVSGGQEVVNAVAEGKTAARGIDQQLKKGAR